MMANTYHMVNIDSDKLRAELSKRVLIPAEVSRDIGFCSAYMSKTLSKGRCNRTTVSLLEQRYGILPETYVISFSSEHPYKEQHTYKQPKESNTATINSISRQELVNIISEAVYQAVSKLMQKEGEH
jgi:hypothetical protein